MFRVTNLTSEPSPQVKARGLVNKVLVVRDLLVAPGSPSEVRHMDEETRRALVWYIAIGALKVEEFDDSGRTTGDLPNDTSLRATSEGVPPGLP